MEIEHGVPQGRAHGKPTSPKYKGLQVLKRDQSAFIPGTKKLSVEAYIRTLKRTIWEGMYLEFRTEEATKDGVHGVRVWRV